MSTNPVSAMDVDSPTGTLKRCSSAPMIHENNANMTASPPTSSNNRDQNSFSLFGPGSQTRPRRFSASSSPLTGSPGGGLRLAPRINQIRQEECADLTNQREQAHEREVQTRMQISQSWEDLRLVNDGDSKQNRMGPLQINLPQYGGNFICNSPSPTRLSSPGFQSPTRTKTYFRRSCSPVLRPSPLGGGAKRKLDEDKHDFGTSPRAKRFHSYTNDRGGLLTTTSSPLPGSLSSVGTPESLSSADSPGFQMRMIDSPSPNRAPPEPMICSKPDQEMAEGPS